MIPESLVREFIGYLSGAVPELHRVEVPLLAKHWDDFKWTVGDRLSGEPAAQQWQPIETAPRGRALLLGYWNALGNWRTVMGSYYCEGELESETDDSGFAPAGWYEATQAYEYLACLDEEPTHWQSLPPGMPKRSPETKEPKHG